MPDRMEAGTFALAAAITGGRVVIEDSVSLWLGALTNKLVEAGVEVTATPQYYEVAAGEALRATNIQTYPYPGFPTDLQAPYATLMTQATGASTIYETMYDGRLEYAETLRHMGAEIDLPSGRMAVVHGPTLLHGCDVCALDIRSGAAMVLAALAAEGTTRIDNVVYIDRGYQNIDGKLRDLGASVAREAEVSPDVPAARCEEPIEWGTVPFAERP